MEWVRYWWVLLAVGLVMEFAADTWMRSPGTATTGSRMGQKPWGSREHFTPSGYRVRVLGFVLTMVGIAVGLTDFAR